MKPIKILLSLILAIQINAFILGIFYSGQVCREGIMSFSDTIKRDEKDKLALITTIIIYPGFTIGAKCVNIWRVCGRVLVKEYDM